jgi:[acyl-carrier-protein] S-malonyltransferase
VVAVIALLAPGQGSQKPGMLEPWLDDPAAAELLASWSEATGLDLARLGTTADADEIKDTAVTQPLVVAAALLAAQRLTAKTPLAEGSPVAGHSVGELAAAAVAGVLPPSAAVALAGVRGREMAAACALEPTGMSAVLGGDVDEVLAALERHGLTPANRNATGQIVAAGPLAALEALAADAPAGARVRALPVAGAFHTHFMAPAEEAMRGHAASVTTTDPALPLLTNFDGSVVGSGAEALDRMIAQVTRPVRWDSCMTTLASLGVTAVIELPPAGTLVGIVKRELPDVARLALKTPDDLDAAAAFISDHTDGAGA